MDISSKKLNKRQELILSYIAEKDDAFMEKYLGGEEISAEEIKRVLRKACLAYELVPVFSGTALKNQGVQMVLDGVIDYLPSPSDLPPIKGNTIGSHSSDLKEEERVLSDEAPFSALAFKLQTDPFVGQLTYFRVYSGILSSGSYVLNASNGQKERVGRILRMHANHREEVKEIYSGEIAAIVGLKNTRTGDTLCDEAGYFTRYTVCVFIIS